MYEPAILEELILFSLAIKVIIGVCFDCNKIFFIRFPNFEKIIVEMACVRKIYCTTVHFLSFLATTTRTGRIEFLQQSLVIEQ